MLSRIFFFTRLVRNFNGTCRHASIMDHINQEVTKGQQSQRQDGREYRERNREGLGDQRTFYTSNLRQNRRVSGDQTFYRNRNDEEHNSYARFNNVSGFGGRGGGGRGADRFASAGMRLRPLDWKAADLSPINKNLYKEHPAVSQRDQSKIREWLAANQCSLKGPKVPSPIFNFEETGFPQPIIDLLKSQFQEPMTTQKISWPVALSGRDIISIAMTGCGKTLAFILPAIVHTINQTPARPRDGPGVLVMLPTRELALQVEEVAKEYCRLMNLQVTCCYGGASKQGQASKLRQGVDICVATPGRMLDFLEGEATNLRRCSFLVLDEADRMLDMGFEPQIRKIVDQIRPDRQTLMFSATWPKEVRNLAADFQVDPVHLQVGSMELAANHNITQHVELVDEFGKQDRLFHLLNEIMQEPECKVLIFVQTKRLADQLTQKMRRNGLPGLCIHGDKSQTEREWVLGEFKSGKAPILLATDIAARGLDVNDIKYVINFDYPSSSEDYVHRIGRTGRQNKKGTSYTFFTTQNAAQAGDLIKVLEEAKQNVPQELREMAFGRGGYQRSRERW